MKSKNQEIKAIKERINEMAVKFCEDYPNIKEVGSFEQLYAIESSFNGTNAANDDLHKVIERLRIMNNLTKDQICKLFDGK